GHPHALVEVYAGRDVGQRVLEERIVDTVVDGEVGDDALAGYLGPFQRRLEVDRRDGRNRPYIPAAARTFLDHQHAAPACLPERRIGDAADRRSGAQHQAASFENIVQSPALCAYIVCSVFGTCRSPASPWTCRTASTTWVQPPQCASDR